MGFQFYRGPEGEDLGPPPPPFRIGRGGASFRGFGGWNRAIGVAVALLIVYAVLNTTKGLYVNWLWFEGAGYESVYSKMLVTRVWLFAAGGLIFAIVFGGNVLFASRSGFRFPAGAFGDLDEQALSRLSLLVLIAGTLFLAVIFGSIASAEWDTVLRYFNAESFGVDDPQFHRDVGFYVFKLPALRSLQGWLLGMLILTTLAAAGIYLMRFLLVGQPPAGGQGKVHLSLLLVAIIAVFIWRYYLGVFELNFSTQGAVFGAGYTDVKARLPVTYALMVLAGVTAVMILANVTRRGLALPGAALAVWLLVAVLGGQAYPSAIVQRLQVEPNELEKERPYIERNIEMTRRAFALDQIDERPFPAAPEVTLAEIGSNPDTIRNIRLLDVRPLLQTYSQIQTIRPLYEFTDVDIDRYTIDGVVRQVLISARELSPGRLPPDARRWVNQRLQFTHGYGLVMSPVNEVVAEGLPVLFMQDIPVTGRFQVTRPEIYYGEEPDHYVIVKTTGKEFGYPIGEGSEPTVFDGGGGVAIGSRLRRLLFAWEFGDINIAISGSLTSESRILYRRNIQDRVRTIAPFLTLDKDPYIVVADGRLYWIQDAYTTSSRYPYSRPAANGVNYIRNSVKITIDAYDGTTKLYLVDQNDPIIRAYARIFPDLLTPLSEMPASLRAHLRYPEDLLLIQANHYRTYHIKDPQVLFNQEDLWSIPTELFADREVPVEPYYVIMRIPGEAASEFALILPLTPARRANTIAWVAARSDGANYGKLLAFRFPTDSLVYGPRQVESRIDQDTAISAQFSLWNQSGSRVIRGNLLMIPIGTGNLFVEPIYLQAETSQLPELKRVVVVNGNRIAMETTLARSLEVIFGQAPPTLPTTTPDTGARPGSPTVTPGPQTPTATRVASTPPAGGTPASVAGLAREADAAYQRAQEALRRGDFATYGTEIARVEELIKRIVQVSGGQ